MDALNRRERVYSFCWFLLLFVLTNILLLVAVFFNYQIPEKENKMLKMEVEKYRKEHLFQQSFHEKIGEITNYLNIVNAPQQNAVYIDQIIAASLADARNKVPKSSANFPFYDNIIQALLSLQQSKQQLRALQHSQEEILSLKDKVNQLTESLDLKSRDLDNCRQMMLLNSR